MSLDMKSNENAKRKNACKRNKKHHAGIRKSMQELKLGCLDCCCYQLAAALTGAIFVTPSEDEI